MSFNRHYAEGDSRTEPKRDLSVFRLTHELRCGSLFECVVWREFFAKHKVEAPSIEMLEQAILPASFFRTGPVAAN